MVSIQKDSFTFRILSATGVLSDIFWALNTTENFPSPVALLISPIYFTYRFDDAIVSHLLVEKFTLFLRRSSLWFLIFRHLRILFQYGN